MKGFETDLVELRNQSALKTDSLICFPSDHSAGAPLLKELVRRSDVVDVLVSPPRLIEPLPSNCGMRIAKCKLANFRLTLRNPQFAIRISLRRLTNAKSHLSLDQSVDR